MLSPEFPFDGILPKSETGAKSFMQKHPNYDGRGVKIAILDTGVDPGAEGLKVTSEGKQKIIDILDATGSGDVAMSTVVKETNGCITGITGRKLKIPSNWNNPSKSYRIGCKSCFQLLPKKLLERVKCEVKKKEFDPQHNQALNEAISELESFEEKKDMNQMEKLTRDDLQAKVDFLQQLEKKYDDCGPVFDCVAFHDGKTWRACVDTSGSGDLSKVKLMASFREEFEYDTFSKIDMMNYVLNIRNNGKVLEISTNAGSHGTHVAGIASAFFQDQPEKCGVAPGAQIVSIKIGDGRLGSMETGCGLIRALSYCIQNKIDIINLSYGEECCWWESGKVVEAMNEVISKYNILLVSSAGNNGPALCTVKAPCSACHNIISVGAYVSPQMMAASYSINGHLPGMVYTWSSRGPARNGGLGIMITAPGAAITSVPNWTLRSNQLMNGTSMSSPNACGGLALVLSGLKAENITYSTFMIRRAIEATAKYMTHVEKFAQGFGMLRVEETFEHIQRYHLCQEAFLKLEITVTPGFCERRMKGIYLRDLRQMESVSDHVVYVDIMFIEKMIENKDKINLSLRLSLTSDQSWVTCGPFLEVMNLSRSFTVKVNPLSLNPGVHYAQITAHDIRDFEKGHLFIVPVTVIKPIIINNEENSFSLNEVTLLPGENMRKFFHVPYGATSACIKLQCTRANQNPKVYLHTIQTKEDEGTRNSQTDRFLVLKTDSPSTIYIKVIGNKTLELTIGRWWAFVGEVNFNFSIQFFSYFVDSLRPVMLPSNGIKRINLTNFLSPQEVSVNISLKYHVQPLRPCESKIRLLVGDRDTFPEKSTSSALELTYNFSKNKIGEVTPDFALLNNLLYENEYESQLWMLYNYNKQYIISGDAYINQYTVKLEKGDYILKLQIRHEKREMLEKLKDFPINLHHKLPSPLSLDIYLNNQNALTGTRKFTSSYFLLSKHTVSHFIAPLSDDKIPKGGYGGHFLAGTLSFAKDENIKKIDYVPFKYVLTENPKKPKPSSTSSTSSSSACQFSSIANHQPNTTPINQTVSKTTSQSALNAVVVLDRESTVAKYEKSSQQTEFEKALFDFKTNWISKLDSISSTTLYNELSIQKPSDPSVQIARMLALDNSKDRLDNLTTIIEIGEKTVSMLNLPKIVLYFSVKSEQHQQNDIKTSMEKLRIQLIDCLIRLGTALCDLILNDSNHSNNSNNNYILCTNIFLLSSSNNDNNNIIINNNNNEDNDIINNEDNNNDEDKNINIEEDYVINTGDDVDNDNNLNNNNNNNEDNNENYKNDDNDNDKTKSSKSVSNMEVSLAIKKVNELMSDLLKLVDINDSKIQNLALKHALVHNHFGRAIKILQKQNEDKVNKLNDEKIIHLCSLLKWDHAVNYFKKWILIKYPPNFLPF